MMTKYFSQLLDQWREHGFESKRAVNYYIELSTDMLVMALTLVQYLQILASCFDNPRIAIDANKI